jgi:hypothetical protein
VLDLIRSYHHKSIYLPIQSARSCIRLTYAIRIPLLRIHYNLFFPT